MITDNNATNGGGIFNFNGTTTITGGSIYNNIATTNGGGIYLYGNSTFGGTVQITGNKLNEADNNLYLPNNKTITIGTDENAPTTMSVGITLQSGTGKFTVDGTADYSSNFFFDNDSYKVCFNNNGTDDNNADDYLELKTAYAITNSTKEDDKETNHGYIVVDKNAVEGEKVVVTVVANSGYELSSLKYNDGTDHDITAIADVYSFEMPAYAVTVFAEFEAIPHIHGEGTEHEIIFATPWDGGVDHNLLPSEAGSYYLVSDVTLSATWNVPEGTTNLCLNGYVINANGGAFTIINVVSGATLNLYDCGNEKYYFNKDSDSGLWTLAENQGTSTDYYVIGGLITGGSGGVYVSGEFNMFNGNIVGNADRGIDISGGTFNLYGGSVVGNTTTGNGGGINNNGTFIMTGGTIAYNKANNGGGLYTSPTAVNILTGGSITGNTATSGGGVYYQVAQCFAPGTLITMADGSRKAIETLQIGDLVRVFDHENGEISSSKIFDVWTYPEKHSGVVKLYFSNDIDVTVVYGHSFFEHEQNKYVAVTRDNVSAFVGHEFYNVDSNCWETLVGYEFIDGEVDTYVITTEYQLNCVASGMLTNEDGFYTMITNIFDYGDDLKIDESKKASDIDQYGIYGFENLKYMSRETYDKLNFQYLNVAIGKGMITTEEISCLGAYWSNVDSELFCDEKEEIPVESKSGLLKAPLKAPLLTSVPAPTTPGIYVGGSIKIINNTSGNLYLSSGKYITIGTGTVGDGNGVVAPTEDMQIGITMADGEGKFTTNGTADDVAYFFSDSDSYKVCFNNNGTDDVATDDYLELKTVYAITNNTKEDDKETNHGYITVDNKAVEGEVVVVTVVANSGYELSSLIYNDGTDNYDITATDSVYSFEMPAKAVSITATFVEKQTISITETAQNYTYDNTTKSFELLGTNSSLTGFTVQYYVDGAWTTTSPKNAGSYNVKITRAEDDTYKAYEEELENGLVIEKAEVSAPTIVSKVYTGITLTADVDDTDTLYTVMTNDGGTAVGDYDVVLVLNDSANYKWSDSEDETKTLTFTITKADNAWTTEPKIDGITYGTAISPVGAAKFGSVTITYVGTGDTVYNSTIAPTNAGTYKATFSVAATNDYGSLTKDVEFTIAKAPVTAPENAGSKPYTGEPLTADVDDTDTLYTVMTNDGGTAVGDYDVVLVLNDSDNYKWSDSDETTKTLTFKITKADNAWTTEPKIDGITYGTAISPVGAAKFGSVTITYVGTGDTVYNSTEAPTNAGTYKATFSVAATNDYGSLTKDVEFTITRREVTLTWGETTFAYDNTTKLPKVTAGNLANDDEVTVTVISNKESVNAGNDYVATATALSNNNYKLPETNLTTNFVINKIDYDMTGITFTDKTVKTTDSDADKKLAVSGTLPTGLDGIGLTVSYVDNDNTARGVYTVTAKFSTTSINYNVPSDMTATLTILWVRDSEKESGSDNEFVIVTSETGIDPTLTLKVDVVKIDNNDSQYKEVTDGIKKESSFNSSLDKVFGVYDVSLINQDNIKVQPDGTIKVYMTIPEEIKNCEFRIYHVHNGVASKAEYVLDDGYAVIETDELSEFVFVYEQTSLLPWIIILSVISALGIAGIVLLLLKNKKDKQGRE